MQYILILTGGMEDAELTIPVSDEEEEDEEDELPKVASLMVSSVFVNFPNNISCFDQMIKSAQRIRTRAQPAS